MALAGALELFLATRGTAYVRISQLSFPNPFRRIDPKIVDKLKRDFGKEGCLVHQQGCSIPAILNEDEFRIGLGKLWRQPRKLQDQFTK
jgi:hypothetical protein